MLSDKRSMNGRTDMVLIKKIILNKSCNVLNFISGEKKNVLPNVVQNRQPYRTQTLIAIPGSTVRHFREQ